MGHPVGHLATSAPASMLLLAVGIALPAHVRPRHLPSTARSTLSRSLHVQPLVPCTPCSGTTWCLASTRSCAFGTFDGGSRSSSGTAVRFPSALRRDNHDGDSLALLGVLSSFWREPTCI